MIFVKFLINCCVILIKFKKKNYNLDKTWQIVSCDYLVMSNMC